MAQPVAITPSSVLPTPQLGIASSAGIEGTAPVGGMPPIAGAGGGTATIMPPVTGVTNFAFWLWVGAFATLIVFWLSGDLK